jgi:hypothetical protein
LAAHVKVSARQAVGRPEYPDGHPCDERQEQQTAHDFLRDGRHVDDEHAAPEGQRRCRGQPDSGGGNSRFNGDAKDANQEQSDCQPEPQPRCRPDESLAGIGGIAHSQARQPRPSPHVQPGQTEKPGDDGRRGGGHRIEGNREGTRDHTRDEEAPPPKRE